jgi:hypothetical protein
MGGNGAGTTVQYAQALAGGGTTTWTSQGSNTLAASEYGLSCASANNYIYCMGGTPSTTEVQYAQILGGGGTTSWTSAGNPLSTGEYGLSCVAVSNSLSTANTLYCMGGFNTQNAVQYASD